MSCVQISVMKQGIWEKCGEEGVCVLKRKSERGGESGREKG